MISGSIRIPPIEGLPMARESTTKYPPISNGDFSSHIQLTNLGPTLSVITPKRERRCTSKLLNSK